MIKSDVRRLSNYKKLVDKLKANPNNIEHTESPIKNSDILKLIELSKSMSKSDAIQFAVRFTLDNIGLKIMSLSPIEEKLEKLRYAKEETHKASDDLLDS